MSTPDDRLYPLLPGVLTGETADVYFLRVRDVLRATGRDPVVGMVVFPSSGGVFCGINQVLQLLQECGFGGQLWAIEEGSQVDRGEAALEIFGRYSEFGLYETAILGILASCTAWSTAAREVVRAASPVPVVSFGARHLHPNVAGFMDYAAIIGGCTTCSTPLGAALAGTMPSGTMPHAYMLVVGDTVEAALEYDRHMDADIPRLVLVDTFQDEAVDTLRVARALGDHLQGVRLDTPSERGGVTPGLVREVRARLDLAGFERVQIHVSGGVTPERIEAFRQGNAPIDGYGVGSYISGARPIDYTADIREIEGRPVSKRGRLPGMPRNPDLKQIL